MRIKKVFGLIILTILFISGRGLLSASHAQTLSSPCNIQDEICILDQIFTAAENIENTHWKDQTYRELAKSYAASGALEKALSLITRVENPDTRAMTIRGIGMEAAELNLPPQTYTSLFRELRRQADDIEHEQSHAIALTYIAMSQAFAGQIDGAARTAADIENEALRDKAYGETAEILAEQRKPEIALQAIDNIQSPAFKDKALSVISKILADKKLYNDAYRAANAIENPYKRSRALQIMMDLKQKHAREALNDMMTDTIHDKRNETKNNAMKTVTPNESESP